VGPPPTWLPVRLWFVNFSAVSDARNAHPRLAVVNEVDHAPIAYPDSPLVPISFELLASRGPWVVTQRFDPSYGACKHVIGQSPKFLPGGRLHLDSVVTHAGGRALPSLL